MFEGEGENRKNTPITTRKQDDIRITEMLTTTLPEVVSKFTNIFLLFIKFRDQYDDSTNRCRSDIIVT